MCRPNVLRTNTLRVTPLEGTNNSRLSGKEEIMKVLVPGHVYELTQLGGGTQRLTFVRRSGGAIQYETEWPGVQTQEVLRALIDRTKYLDGVLPCQETKDALWHLRMALYAYEVRAWRRKQEAVNREAGAHDDIVRPHDWREHPDDVPFNEHGIESRPVGPDGHIIVGSG